MYSVGVDSVEIERMKSFVVADEKLGKVFSSAEQQYCQRKSNPLASFAGIFTAKEAFLKALKIGIGGKIELKDIIVLHSNTGSPLIELSQNAKNVVLAMGIKGWDISITHTKSVATAVCICWK